MDKSIDLLRVAKEICNKNSFKFIAEKGEGTFKKTYSVSKDGTVYALKVYKPEQLDQRGIREIEAMKKCNHPNIAKLIFINLEEIYSTRILYTLEEYLDGGTLSDRLNKKGSYSYKDLIELGTPIIKAVDHIQSLSLVHRDLKPENILFRKKDLSPVITDFGIVRDLNQESLTQSWHMRGPGTAFYAAPEQLNNEKELIDWRTDQFSLGVMFSICVFGEHPFGKDPELAISNAALYKSPTMDFQNKVKDTRLFAIEKMVQAWPVKRYRTPKELLDGWLEQGR